MKKIVLLPLDERPCNYDFPGRLFTHGSETKIVVPGRLGNKKTPADTEQIRECYVKLPKEKNGRYVQFKVNLVETPDTGGVTGILTVTDITEQAISERILRQLSVTSYDLVVDVDVLKDSYTVLTGSEQLLDTLRDIRAAFASTKLPAVAQRAGEVGANTGEACT